MSEFNGFVPAFEENNDKIIVLWPSKVSAT